MDGDDSHAALPTLRSRDSRNSPQATTIAAPTSVAGCGRSPKTSRPAAIIQMSWVYAKGASTEGRRALVGQDQQAVAHSGAGGLRDDHDRQNEQRRRWRDPDKRSAGVSSATPAMGQSRPARRLRWVMGGQHAGQIE